MSLGKQYKMLQVFGPLHQRERSKIKFLVVVAIWGMSQQKEDLFLLLPSLYNAIFQIKIKIS